MNLLVLHGPNLNLLGERPGDDARHTLAALDAALKAKARELGAQLKVTQSNHEGVLIDTLHAQRRWADGVVLNPAALAVTSYALRDAIAAIRRPTYEVHLGDLRRGESWRRKSVLREVCAGRLMGKGFASYLEAMERLAAPARPDWRPKAGMEGPRAKLRPDGDKLSGAPRSGRTASPKSRVLSREILRKKIAERLAGRISASGLSTWARSQWLEVQGGAPAESGQRELLEDSLQTLALPAVAAKLSDDQLITLMVQLEK
jgi:3-dehydroquinate dehydratase-2